MDRKCDQGRQNQSKNYCLKMTLGDSLVNILSAYAPYVGKIKEAGDRFWNYVFQLVISHTRTVVREYYKDDGESLWKSLKFDHSPR